MNRIDSLAQGGTALHDGSAEEPIMFTVESEKVVAHAESCKLGGTVSI
jgi:hypothetical protein